MDENFLIFTVPGGKYAIQSRLISEVAALDKVFPLPLVPPYVRGIINRYSVPYALIDLCFMLFNGTSDCKKLIILKEEIDKIAFLIDDVTDIAGISEDKIMKIGQEDTADPAGMTGGGNFAVSGFFEWNGSQIFYLDTNDILSRIKRDFEYLVT